MLNIESFDLAQSLLHSAPLRTGSELVEGTSVEI